MLICNDMGGFLADENAKNQVNSLIAKGSSELLDAYAHLNKLWSAIEECTGTPDGLTPVPEECEKVAVDAGKTSIALLQSAGSKYDKVSEIFSNNALREDASKSIGDLEVEELRDSVGASMEPLLLDFLLNGEPAKLADEFATTMRSLEKCVEGIVNNIEGGGELSLKLFAGFGKCNADFQRLINTGHQSAAVFKKVV